ncbi:MAG: transketolase [Acholeplasmatales bacterium]|nr:transketolase [Acholeplasmatales bacterium]
MSSNDTLSINSLRVIGAEIIGKAKSGHPGIVLGAAPMAHTLFTRHLNINPANPKWYNRDRFILSAGHGSMLLYMLLHLAGFKLSMDDLKNFRQKGSLTPGHPEFGHTDGVELSTGPLGQGLSTSVGLALAESFLEKKFNKDDFKIIDNYTYVLCGDGDLEEGISMEAISLAGHWKLNKLIVLYDSNDIQLDGPCKEVNSENIKDVVVAKGWNHILVKDGNNPDDIDKAIKEAKKSSKPTMIEIKTIIGHGAPNQGTNDVHGKPMPQDDVLKLKENLNYNYDTDNFPQEVKDFYKENVLEKGKKNNKDWDNLLEDYCNKYKEDGILLKKFINDEFVVPSFDKLPKYEAGSKESTRNEMGKILSAIVKEMPNVLAGTADLSSSTKVKGADGVYGVDNRCGRDIKFGVREHAMAAIVNGITVYGGLKGVGSSFFVFSDYLKPAVRLAAIMNLPSLFFFSHDTVCVGEDGPTHQPIEHLTMFRSMPNTNVFRPADANELTGALVEAFKTKSYPTIITTTRQPVLNLENTDPAKVACGAYVVYGDNNSDYIIVSTGADLSLSIDLAKSLKEEGINVKVVSMPSMFLFDKQNNNYKEEVLPSNMKNKTMAIEMGSTMPWYKYANYVYGIDEFGKSMPISEIFNYYGFTVDNLKNVFKKNFNI